MTKGLIIRIRKSKLGRILSAYLALSFLFEIISPSLAIALTSGPEQPEVQSFEPVTTTDMVDLFSGDFTYNIPLFDLPGPNGGYPFNLAYHAGIGMDQEASWVGLGWNINPGVINRAIRGLPDDFNGDEVVKKLDMKNNVTFGASFGKGFKVFGKKFNNQFSIALSAYYNNYKGIGYSLEPGFSIGSKSKDDYNMNFGLSLDSQEGVGVSANVGYNQEQGQITRNFYAGGSLNSKKGLNIFTGGRAFATHVRVDNRGGETKLIERNFSTGGRSVYSFSSQSYSPQISESYTSSNLTFSFKSGSGGAGLYKYIEFGGFYTQDFLRHKNKNQNIKSYGYNNYENANPEKRQMLDFNREKDGSVIKESPNLAAPIQTYDYYNVAGQGTGGMFRPFRNRVGKIYNPKVQSFGVGGMLGIEIGPQHTGLSASLNYSRSVSDSWKHQNNTSENVWDNFYNYNDDISSPTHDYEKVYYKVHGENTSYPVNEKDYIGGEGPVRAAFERFGTDLNPRYSPRGGYLIEKNGNEISSGISATAPSLFNGRKSRNTAVQPVENFLIASNLLNEFNVQHYNPSEVNMYANEPAATLNRTTRNGKSISHHTGGFSTTNPDGQRYIYALPVYNQSSTDVMYTTGSNNLATMYSQLTDNTPPNYEIDKTDKLFSSQTTPPHATSYLLTQVLGADYIDADNVPGPSDGDFGYWVKFNYVKTTDNYRWRAPFRDAMLDIGYETTAEDNKASFSTGQRETWHLATTETRTHIAVFRISPRKDGKDAAYEYNHEALGTNVSYKLDRIDLYSKQEYQKYRDNNNYIPIPIKSVHFVYDNSLCKFIHNTIETNTNDNGKLTLKQVFFTYQNNSRGSLSPYSFDYNRLDAFSQEVNYSITQYDRWGNYASDAELGQAYYRSVAPWVKQYNTGAVQNSLEKAAFKNRRDKDASIWSLSKITLPSGGEINVTYEADDYGYVQHMPATEMIKIFSMKNQGSPSVLYFGKNDPFEPNDQNDGDGNIYFNLETPIEDDGIGGQDAENELFRKLYVDGLKRGDEYQLYYKVHMKLRKPTDNITEFVSGYANLIYNDCKIDVGSQQSIDGKNVYTRGVVRIDKVDGQNFHPFSLAGWQHMRTNQPKLLMLTGNIDETPGTSKMDNALKAKAMLGWLPEIKKVFSGGYKNSCFNQDFSSQIDLSNSYIRLCTPDKKKFGGGIRVKKIELSDKWNTTTGGLESNSTYGLVYTYETTETIKIPSTGASVTRAISSGVAQYEPLIGGDEIPLRYAKRYNQSIPIMTDNDLFFEYPVNESLYPGASVGYSKVTVESLASHNASLPGSLPSEFKNTGVAEYEFYTAKEFPVISDETEADKRFFDLFIPLPFIGQIVSHGITATQGYSIILNDMHGRIKSVANFAKDNSGKRAPSPVNKVEYFYKSVPRHYDDQAVLELDNTVTVMGPEKLNVAGTTFESDKYQAIVGEEYEFYTDQRRSKSFSVQAGLDFNLDFLAIGPLPTVWPSLSTNKTNLKTAVTNKIIFRTGILIKTVATDGQSVVSTENIAFDALTGRPLLTKTKNDFEGDIFNYTYPAHWAYSGMGPAYKNMGYNFGGSSAASGTIQTIMVNNVQANTLFPGDELLVISTPSGAVYGKATITEINKVKNLSTGLMEYSVEVKAAPQLSTSGSYSFSVYRSGRRNHLTADAGAVTALLDPTDNANRNFLSLPGFVPGIADELAAFLNSKMANNELQQDVYNMNNSGNRNLQGEYEHFFPTLEKIYAYLKTTMGTAASEPADGCPRGECKTNFYQVEFANKVTGEFGVGACIQRKMNGSQPRGMVFSKNDENSLLVQYDDLSTSIVNIECMNNTYTPKQTYFTQVLNTAASEFRDTWLLAMCDNNLQCNDLNTLAILTANNWKAWKNYYYKDERHQQTANVKLSSDGVFDGDVVLGNPDYRFFPFKWGSDVQFPVNSRWIGNQTMTKYDINGLDLENKDILGIYSSAQYSNDRSLVKAVVSNAKSDEMVFEDFEEERAGCKVNFSNADETPGCWGNSGGPESPPVCCAVPTSDAAHTGKKSLPVNTQVTVRLNQIKLIPGKEYYISCWIAKQGGNTTPSYEIPNTETNGVKIEAFDPGTSSWVTTFLKPEGRIIEGWQRIEGKFKLFSSNPVHLKISLKADGTMHFDDFRLMPAKASMMCYVYNMSNFRLIATLDENNYASLYSYDEEGNLFLVKKETMLGIKTIQESRSHIKE